MEAAIAISHPEGAEHCTDGTLRCARDALEDRLLHRIHYHVFGALSDEATHDKLLTSRLRALAALLTPAQLDVPPAFCDTRFNRWTAAAAELGLMCERRTARGKMDCVLQCVLQLKQGLLECLSAQGQRGSFGADELFPVFVYVVLVCQPPQLASTLAYVQRFRSPMALKSEAGCYFTHLQAAVSFLEGLAVQRVEGEDAGEARLGDAELNGEVNHRPHPNGENRKLNGELNAEAASPSTCPSSPRVQGTPSESTAKVAAPSEVAAPSHDVCVCAYEPQAADDVAGDGGQDTESHTDDAAAAGPARTRSHSNPASTDGESTGGESACGESAGQVRRRRDHR